MRDHRHINAQFFIFIPISIWPSFVYSHMSFRRLSREQKAILKEYGNHPSFVLYCNGNEITGNFDFIEELTHYLIHGRNHLLDPTYRLPPMIHGKLQSFELEPDR